MTVSGAVHSADIEYFMGNLATNTVFAWTAEDVQLSTTMQHIYVNFVKYASPNGVGVPDWMPLVVDQVGQFMRIDVESVMEHDRYHARYAFLDTFMGG